ncbi:MAG: GNAT family N-acetyltransferase [Hyphomicrobiales bacterium]
MTVTIRPARPGDEATILGFIRDLAEYEKLSHMVEATAGGLAAALFAAAPRVFCDIAELDGAPAGFALWFYNFSTFLGRNGLYLEDLYVRPEARRRGVGEALLSGLAARCKAENLGRLEWSVLDWNTPAIDFYKSIGAVAMDEWTVFRVTGDALDRLAERR